MRSQLAVISVLTGISQLVGFVKLWFIANIFGVGSALDGYNLALVLPTMMSGVIAGVLQTGLFPVRAALRESGDTNACDGFERSVLLAMFVTGTAISIVLVLASQLLTGWVAPTASAEVASALAFSFPVLASLVALNTVGDCAGFLLAMRGRFAIAAAAPIANAVIASALLAAWPQGGLLNLTVGTVCGLAVQVACCLWGLHRSGFRLTGSVPPWAVQARHWKEMIWLGASILPGVVLANLMSSLPPVWVTGFGDGAVSAFGYAYRLHASAVQLLILASSTVILARFSELIARKDHEAIQSILRKAGLASAVIGGLVIVYVWLLGSWTLQLLLGGRFDAGAADRVAVHWLWLSLGLPFALLGNVFAKLWLAQKQPRRMSLIAGLSLGTAALVYLLTGRWLSEYSVAAGLSSASLAVVLIGWNLVKVEIFRANRSQPEH